MAGSITDINSSGGTTGWMLSSETSFTITFTSVSGRRYRCRTATGTGGSAYTNAFGTASGTTTTFSNVTGPLPTAGNSQGVYLQEEAPPVGSPGPSLVWVDQNNGTINRVRAPVVSDSQSFTSTNTDTVSHTISFTTTGLGGTAEFAASNTNVYTSVTGWQASSSFTVTRGQSYYFWARNLGKDSAAYADASTLQTVPIVPPTVGTQSFVGTSVQFIGHTITLSATGGGGTLEYAISTSSTYNTSLVYGWQSSNAFSATASHLQRGQTYWFWARRGDSAGLASSSGQQIPYLQPDLDITAISDFTLGAGLTSFNITIANGTAGTMYVVRDSGTDTFRANLNGNGNLNVPDTTFSNVPGATKTYVIKAYKLIGEGGEGASSQVLINGDSDFVVTREDAQPNAFSFNDEVNVGTSSLRTSNQITVGGLGSGVSVPVTVSGAGTFSINGGAYGTTGNVVNGNTVTVQHTSSASLSTAVSTTITIGGSGQTVSDTWTSTTEPDRVCTLNTTPTIVGGVISLPYNHSTGVSGILGGCTSTDYYRFRCIQSSLFDIASQTGNTSLTFNFVEPGPDGGTISYQAQASYDNVNWIDCTAPAQFSITKAVVPAPSTVSAVTGSEQSATASITVSATGGSGTYEYNVTASATTPTTGWAASGTFTATTDTAAALNRGSTYYIWARSTYVFGSTYRSSPISSTYTLGYLLPDLSLTGTSIPTSVAFNDTNNITYTWSGNSTPTRYKVQQESPPSTWVDVTLAAINVSSRTLNYSENDIPPPGSSNNYRVIANILATDGGTEQFSPTNLSWTLSRTAVSAPTDIVFTDAGSPSASVNIVATASPIFGIAEYSQDGVSWGSNNVFPGSRGLSVTAYTRNLYTYTPNGLNYPSGPFQETFPIPYLAPDNVIDTINPITVSPAATSFVFTLANGETHTVYQVRQTSYGGIVLRTVAGPGSPASTNITVNDVPAQGATKTYYISAYRSTTSGGGGIGFQSSVTTFTVTRQDDVTVETYTNLGGNVTDAIANTYYYATFSTAIPFTTADGTNFTIAGISNPVVISPFNGEYRIGAGAYTSTSGTVNSPSTVNFRALTATSPTTLRTHSLQIGDITRSFTTTTGSPDTTPSAFNFPDAGRVTKNTIIYFSELQITGFDTATSISVSGSGSPEYKISTSAGTSPDAGTWTSTAGTLSPSRYVRVRHRSANTDNTLVTSTIDIGGVTDNFSSETYRMPIYNLGNITLDAVTTTSKTLGSNDGSDVTVGWTSPDSFAQYRIRRLDFDPINNPTPTTTVSQNLTVGASSTLLDFSGGPYGNTPLPSQGYRGSYRIQIRVPTGQGGDEVWYAARRPDNSLASFTISRIAPPVVLDGQPFDRYTNSSTITHGIVLADSGEYGTLEYAVSTSSTYNASLVYSWTTNNAFVLTRGNSYYLWARRADNIFDSDRSNALEVVPPVSVDYGIAVYNSSGTRIFDTSSRIARSMISSGTVVVSANSWSSAISGISLDNENVAHVVVTAPALANPADYPTTAGLFEVEVNYAPTNTFRIRNNAAVSLTYSYYVFRTG